MVIKSKQELENYILAEYYRDDTELNSLFFDIEIEMKERDILEAYASIQHDINGDHVIRVINPSLDSSGNLIYDEEAKDLIPDEKYNSFYKGNCKEFLESFNGKETITGLCRYDEDNLLDFIW